VAIFLFCFDHQIFYVDLQVSPNLFSEGGVHATLKGSSGVFEAERHNLVVIVLSVCHESSFWSIKWVHLDLIVSEVGFH